MKGRGGQEEAFSVIKGRRENTDKGREGRREVRKEDRKGR